MLSVEEAVVRLYSQAKIIAKEVESVSVDQSLGRVVAESIRASIDVPPADNSAMDGYAFCFRDAAEQLFRLPISQRIPAGIVPEILAKNSAARIFTGAELPEGADTVVAQEVCIEENAVVTIDSSVTFRQHVRLQGQDIRRGEIILKRGTCIKPEHMGLLSSVGLRQLSVYRPLRVAVFSTGDELVDPGEKLQPGQIYNSNRSLLMGAISALGMDPIDIGSVADNIEATAEALQNASDNADVIISAGGISVGEEDHVKHAVEQLGEVDFWRVAIKPGKPMAFGRIKQAPFIGLPGNPASVFVTFSVLAKPFLLASQGVESVQPVVAQAYASFQRPAESREVYLRGLLSTDGGRVCVHIYANQSSGVLSSVTWGNVLIRQRVGQKIAYDDLVDVLPY